MGSAGETPGGRLENSIAEKIHDNSKSDESDTSKELSGSMKSSVSQVCPSPLLIESSR